MSVTIRKDGLADLVKNVETLTSTQILVGIPADAPARTPDPDEPEVPSNALIGYIMEFGDPDKNIPPRPSLLPGIERVEDRISTAMRGAGRAALEGRTEELEQRFVAIGTLAANSVRAQVTDGDHQPLAPKTLAKRRARGRTGVKPLLDTGQFRRSFTYVIRKRGK